MSQLSAGSVGSFAFRRLSTGIGCDTGAVSVADIRGFEALNQLRGGRAFAVGTWFLIEADQVPHPLPEKSRPVVASAEAVDGGIVVFPRSASHPCGHEHRAHEGHNCDIADPHDPRGPHRCHIDSDGYVDLDTPITLSSGSIRSRVMCFEDEGSVILRLLERGSV